MRVKEESEKAGSKLNIQEMKIMASGPITSWQTDGEKVEAVTDSIFLGSKITAVTVAMKLKKMLAPWKESYDKSTQSLKKQRHHLANKVLCSQRYGFSISHVQM